MSGIGHNSQAVAQASYADFKLVKTRSTAQIVLEIPIEEAGAFVDAFGLPIPGHEIHVAVARLQVPAKDEVSAKRGETTSAGATVDTSNNSAARDRFRSLGKPEQTVAKCAMLCSDDLFKRWVWQNVVGSEDWPLASPPSDEQTAQWVRMVCGVKSRSELAGNDRAQEKWNQLVTEYDIWRGALPEVR